MEKHIIELLNKQIQDISYNKPLKASDKLDDASEEIKNLQNSIYYLSDCLLESNKFLNELNQGNLNAVPPSRNNFLSGYLKELHAVMSHIAWQAEQVANGDYSQKMSFMGKLSDSFNIMIYQLRERRARLEEKSYTDELTGIYNRRYCKDSINKLLADHEDFSFAMLDVDQLKRVNDKFGHSTGDEYINLVAKTVKDNIKAKDIFCRVAGDEFTIIFKNLNERSAKEKMKRIRLKLIEIERPYNLSISYGVIHVPAETSLKTEEIFELSDIKMYKFKNKHRIIN